GPAAPRSLDASPEPLRQPRGNRRLPEGPRRANRVLLPPRRRRRRACSRYLRRPRAERPPEAVARGDPFPRPPSGGPRRARPEGREGRLVPLQQPAAVRPDARARPPRRREGAVLDWLRLVAHRQQEPAR